MRDKVKNKDYFKNSLSFTNESINDFENVMPQVLERQGEESQGAKNGYNALVMYYTKKVNLLYSLGEEVLEVQIVYEKLLSYYAKAWNIEYGYIELVRILSLGILLKIESSNLNFKILEKKIKSVGLNDFLINYLLTYIGLDWELNSNEFYFKGIYEPLKDIIEESDENNSKNMLKTYLEKQWYEIHNECAWHSTHKSKQDTYYGYWAYEAGVIAKILRLDDKELKEQQYYPYDLVHFQG